MISDSSVIHLVRVHKCNIKIFVLYFFINFSANIVSEKTSSTQPLTLLKPPCSSLTWFSVLVVIFQWSFSNILSFEYLVNEFLRNLNIPSPLYPCIRAKYLHLFQSIRRHSHNLHPYIKYFSNHSIMVRNSAPISSSPANFPYFIFLSVFLTLHPRSTLIPQFIPK